MCLSLGTTAFAANSNVATYSQDESTYSMDGQNIKHAEDLLDELRAIDFGKEIDFFLLPQSDVTTRSVNNEMLQFDSVNQCTRRIVRRGT